jgi:hypothetical protein
MRLKTHGFYPTPILGVEGSNPPAKMNESQLAVSHSDGRVKLQAAATPRSTQRAQSQFF